jgi:hypothetical protein
MNKQKLVRYRYTTEDGVGIRYFITLPDQEEEESTFVDYCRALILPTSQKLNPVFSTNSSKFEITLENYNSLYNKPTNEIRI